MGIMRLLPLAAVALLAGCGSSSSPAAPELVGTTWQSDNGSNTVATSYQFDSNGNYIRQVLALVSANGAEVSAETGTYTVSGNTISLTPQQSTCPGADPPYTATYSFSGGDLVMNISGTIDTFIVDASAGSATGFQIQEGCFTTTGFAAMQLTAVP